MCVFVFVFVFVFVGVFACLCVCVSVCAYDIPALELYEKSEFIFAESSFSCRNTDVFSSFQARESKQFLCVCVCVYIGVCLRGGVCVCLCVHVISLVM